MEKISFPNAIEIVNHDSRGVTLSLLALYFLVGWLLLVRFFKPKTWAELLIVLALGVAWNIA